MIAMSPEMLEDCVLPSDAFEKLVAATWRDAEKELMIILLKE